MATRVPIRKLSFKTLLLINLLFSVSCSLPVRPAGVPSQPPVLEPKIFESSRLVGQYVQFSAPKMFLWPTFKVDPQSGEKIPMTLAEQAISRQKIIFSAEKIQYYESAVLEAEDEINQKYDSLLGNLENKFKDMRCYSYCNPEDFIFCDPSDDSVLFIEDWMESQDPLVQEIILTCQDNQLQREDLNKKKEIEESEKVTPLRQQAAFHAQDFFTEIGDDYYTDFSRLQFSITKDALVIELEFGSLKLSNSSQLPLQQQIVDVQLDRIEGFLSFRSTAFSKDGEPVGEIFYDLELTFTEEGFLRVEGDVRLQQEGKKERVGRLSSAGIMK